MIFFTDKEVEGLDPVLVAKLNQARQLAGVPFVVNCGYRSPEHNAEIGGVEDSAHTKGLAVDLACLDSSTRFNIVKGALMSGFRRVEVADKHIHLDIDSTKPQDVMWIGVSK